MEEANIDPRRYPVGAVRNAISKAKSSLIDLAAYSSTVESYYEEVFQKLVGDLNISFLPVGVYAIEIKGLTSKFIKQ